MSVSKLSVIDFPEDEAQEFIRMKGISLFPLDTHNHKIFQQIEHFMNLQPIGVDSREEIEITPMWIGQFHHDKRIDLDIKLEPLRVLIEEIYPSV